MVSDRPVSHSGEGSDPEDRGPPSLEEVLDQYLQELADGKEPDREKYIEAYPELARSLRGLFKTLEFVEATGRTLNAARLEEGQALGDFTIVREIGRGGMGVVYEATQTSLNRRVALKVLAMSTLISENALQRFEREATLAGKLDHANIVPVYMVGEEQGIHYYVMQYIEGTTLSDHLKKGRKNGLVPDNDYFRTVARWGAQIGKALAYAHGHGTVHRDIKPSNLLLDKEGNVWITDFGLARADAQKSLTLTGDIVGTARYMSPEQAQGGGAKPDERTDVYSLGATLYELLTFTPAYDGDSRETVLNSILVSRPLPPRQVNRAIPRDLETIVLKCMQKDADDRYEGADGVADDCERFLDGRAVLARRTRLWLGFVRMVKRNKLRVAGSLLLVVMGLIVVALFFKVRLEQGEKHLDEAFTAIFFKKDFQHAEQLLDEASSLGIDSERLHLYRGLIPVFLDDQERAHELLKKTLDHFPDSAETCFALAYTYHVMADTLNRDRFLQRAESLEIDTPLAWFLRGMALSDTSGTKALESYNQALALSPDFFPALEVRAKYRADLLLTQGKADELEPMLNDYNAWVLLQPHSAWAYAARASGWLYAAAFARPRPDMQDEHIEWLEKCGDDLDRALTMQQESDFRPSCIQGLYLRYVGDYEGSLNAYARANEIYRSTFDQDHPPIIHHEALALFALGDLEKTRSLMERAFAVWPENRFPFPIQHAILLADLKEIESAKEALLRSMDSDNRLASWLIPTAACMAFIGFEKEAGERLLELEEDLGRTAGTDDEKRVDRIGDQLDYLLGRKEADTLIASAKAQPGVLCEYYLLIAFRELGRGNRSAGLDALRQCLDTGVCTFVEFRFAQVLKTRLESDEDWPHWL